jgi:hypothetical protein
LWVWAYIGRVYERAGPWGCPILNTSSETDFAAATRGEPFAKEAVIETRQLMLNENLDAGSAAVRVGYESASQFSREYSRLFGAPPQRDIRRLRLAPAAAGGGPSPNSREVHS